MDDYREAFGRPGPANIWFNGSFPVSGFLDRVREGAECSSHKYSVDFGIPDLLVGLGAFIRTIGNSKGLETWGSRDCYPLLGHLVFPCRRGRLEAPRFLLLVLGNFSA